jgi:hypothetical protein
MNDNAVVLTKYLNGEGIDNKLRMQTGNDVKYLLVMPDLEQICGKCFFLLPKLSASRYKLNSGSFRARLLTAINLERNPQFWKQF